MSDVVVAALMAAVAALGGVCMSRYAGASRRRLRDLFPTDLPDTVVYRAAKARACAEGGAGIARLPIGGDVEVIVSDAELWVRPAAVAGWFTSGAEWGLLHRARLDRISSAEVTRGLGGKSVVVTFDGADECARRLKVQVRDPHALVAALGRCRTVPSPSVEGRT